MLFLSICWINKRNQSCARYGFDSRYEWMISRHFLSRCRNNMYFCENTVEKQDMNP